MRAAVVVLGLLLSSQAVAEPNVSPPGMTPPMEPAPPPAAEKSGAAATFFALAGTAAPILAFSALNDSDGGGGTWIMLGASMVLLPSAGHWYAGKFFTAGMGLRALGTTVTAGSLFLLIASEGSMDGVAAIGLLGLGTLAIGAGYDIITASSEVDRWNKQHARVMPTALKTGDGYGVGFVGRF